MQSPTDYDLDPLCNEILTAIELDELKLLDWGFVDVQTPLEQTLPDILAGLTGKAQALWDDARQWGIDYRAILENLDRRKMLFKQTIAGEPYYRSRFAETIRLLALLRQRFSFQDWQTGSRLVSDFKLDVRPRSYPRFDVALAEIRTELARRRANPLYVAAVARLLEKSNGKHMALARFQADALLQQYDALHDPDHSGFREHALVIGAGTGAGKTKAFYIPAMAEIAARLSRERHVRALALYPRVELLKDQLAEAFQEARKLDDLLKEYNKPRKIVLGAYYQDTPRTARAALEEREKWKSAEGWACPFFFCSRDHSPKALIWSKKDIEACVAKGDYTFARLRCPSCGFTVTHDELLLTRAQMIATPPDILFTTTEMLNRRMSKVDEHHLFGCHVGSYPPFLLLLDEIHTNEGLQGAQIAYLLRRWRYNRRLGNNAQQPLCCVGLSATLRDAEAFFAKLTGIPGARVHYVEPQGDDLEESGAEYNVLLKGDPVAGTSLLSTSVQTVMLLARMLDSRTRISQNTYGLKVFAFSDKLDVTNRWYQIELNAEQDRKLSQYRSLQNSDPLRWAKSRAGQNWETSTLIGHNLKRGLEIDRVSSQDRGVNSQAQLIVATSTLEVGYNDPDVGAVVQHKAPHSLASFLQRKGRAGRRQEMRPWMVVVTSEYGRDRWAFQHEENLFSPNLTAIDLPVENYYVRKIQATYALLDWLSLKLKLRLPATKRIDLWSLLNGQLKIYTPEQRDAIEEQRDAIIVMVKEVLEDGQRRQEFAQYLWRALDLHSQQEIDLLLWEEPRSLIFAVLPTLLRQLETHWRDMSSNNMEWADALSDKPLPDFMTPTLFADLQTFEIPLFFKDADSQRKQEMLALYQSLVEFAPGNVSKRYALSRRRKEAHWVPLPADNILSVKSLSSGIIAEKFPEPYSIDGQTYQLYIPRKYELQLTPENLNSSSNAYLLWKSHFTGKAFGGQLEEAGEGAELISLAKRSRWQPFFGDIRCYTQASGGGVEVVRLAVGLQASLRYDREQEERKWVSFQAEDGELEGLGFINHVDALRFELLPLNIEECIASTQWPELLRALRPEYFRYRLQTHLLALQHKLSPFELEWLWQLEFSLLTSLAVEQYCSLGDAAKVVRATRQERAEAMLQMIFQAQQTEDAEEERFGRLHENLMSLIASDDIQQLLNECETGLWQPADEAFYSWLRQCYASSLGAALFATVTRLVSDIDPDDLHMDLDGTLLWISEVVPGGIGIIRKIVDVLKVHPVYFDLQMQDTLAFCERQQLGEQLEMVAECFAQGDQELSALFAGLRQNAALATQQKVLNELKSALEQRGVSATRDFMVALLARFLRPNSSDDSDQLIAHLIAFALQTEQRLQCTLDLRIVAAAALADADLAAEVGTLLQRIGGEEPDQNQMFHILQSLLWFSCTSSCPDCIEEQHPFQKLAKPSRHLLQALLQADQRKVVYGEEDWYERVRKELVATYRVQVLCSQKELSACKSQLLHLLIEPVDIGFQFFYPLVERVTRAGKMWTIEMRIGELAYV